MLKVKNKFKHGKNKTCEYVYHRKKRSHAITYTIRDLRVDNSSRKYTPYLTMNLSYDFYATVSKS